MMVVGRRADMRWALAGLLGLGPDAAVAPDLAAARLAHPSSEPPDAVVLVVDAHQDVHWLHHRTARAARGWVPVVALVTRDDLEAAASGAGARAVVPLAAVGAELAARLHDALRAATAPAAVIHLDGVRSA